MLCFSRIGLIRFISHLDWLVMVERILTRAHMPLSYTEGHRPRVVMKGSPPLPTGIESNCEMLQIFLREHLDPKEVARRLSVAVPEGVGLEWVQQMRFKPPKNPYKAIAAAEYTIELKEPLSGEKRERMVSLLNALRPDTDEDELQFGPDPAVMKPIAGRLLEIKEPLPFIEGEVNELEIIGMMDANETLHAAKLGFFLYETVPLTRIPRILKLAYLRRTNKGLEPVFVR